MTDIMMFLTLGWIMFIYHWWYTVPLVIVTFFIGLRSGYSAIWLLLLVATGYMLLPVLPGAAQHESAMVYLALPFLVPFYVLMPFGLGQLVRWLRRNRTPTVRVG